MPTTPNDSTIRVTKRKLDDAFQSLDDAVAPDRPSPPKRSHTIHSLYSTLAKYGIKSKESRPIPSTTPNNLSTSKNTPHLTAILNRAATRTRKVLPFKSFSATAPSLLPTAEYRPSSLPAFLSRLATFKLATYSQKPSAIDAVAASKCGWINEGKDRLVCGLCKSSWVVGGRDGMNKDAANALVEKQRISLVEMHKDGCPWKARQCDPSIYRIPLQSPTSMVRGVKTSAIALEPFLQNIEIKHPLTLTQLSSLHSTISSFELPSTKTQSDGADLFTSAQLEPPVEPSDTAVLVSLFGWSLVPPAPPESFRRTSLSRANSLVSSTPCTPSLSRASSVKPMTPTSSDIIPMTPTPASPQRPPMTPTRIPSTPFTFRMSPNIGFKRDTSLLQCTLCQRRIGLWAFAPQPSMTVAHESPQTPCNDSDIVMDPAPSTDIPPSSSTSQSKKTPQRQFDILKEHRSYCPYVVRSTFVPSLPVPSSVGPAISINGQNGSSTLEGWRAVLTVILRYGLGQKQRFALNFRDDSEEQIEVDGVRAMVAGVKSRGGKDLLKYVKGLLS